MSLSRSVGHFYLARSGHLYLAAWRRAGVSHGGVHRVVAPFARVISQVRVGGGVVRGVSG
jgi:hypothetical protein